MPKYGLISAVDATSIEICLKQLIGRFPNDIINITEVGVYAGETGNGMREFLKERNRECFITGVDNFVDSEPMRFAYDKFIDGNSDEVYNQFPNNSQHVIMIDANHSYPAVVSDFFCYSKKVKVGGAMLFHDTGLHIKPKTHYQKNGSKEDPDMYISVRKALLHIGLLDGKFPGWTLTDDTYDKDDEAGGFCVLRKRF